jgi:surface protein
MDEMFSGCTSLTSLNLSSFDTSRVKSMNNIFNECTSLTFLDLYNFNASLLSNCIFNSNKNLEYVNLKGEMIGQSLIFLEKCDDNPPNLTICSDNDGDTRLGADHHR